MKIKIVADSSADTLEFEEIEYKSVPLVISTDKKNYVDDENLDVDGMIKDLKEYKGKSKTACPSAGQWLESFGDSEEIYVVTITSNLSGSYNSAMVAKDMYLEEHPNAKIHVFDTLSTGPEMRLLIEKLAELINKGNEFVKVVEEANNYLKTTKLFFSLESLHNLAQNGRVSKLSEIAAKVLNIKIIGQASINGVLEILNKKSGLIGMSCISSDSRDVMKARAEGNQNAIETVDAFVYRVAKYIGAYTAAMNGVDAIAFTAGVGENDKDIRKMICEYLGYLGVEIDDELNNVRGDRRIISTPNSKVKVLLLPTNEELAIARETYKLCK